MTAPRDFLLLRGLGRHQRHWGDFGDRLAAELGVRVHYLDLPGFGTEHARPAPADIDATTDDVRARWRDIRAEAQGPWGLMAISLGGMVAMSWAARYPEDLAALVVINTSTRDLGLPWERMHPLTLQRLLRAAAARDLTARERMVLEATSVRRSDLDDTARRWAELEREFAPLRRRNVVRQLVGAMRFRAPARWSTPTLLLASEGDTLASHRCSARLAARVGCPLEVHPHAGHDIPRDEPEWVLDRVRMRFF